MERVSLAVLHKDRHAVQDNLYLIHGKSLVVVDVEDFVGQKESLLKSAHQHSEKELDKLIVVDPLVAVRVDDLYHSFTD